MAATPYKRPLKAGAAGSEGLAGAAPAGLASAVATSVMPAARAAEERAERLQAQADGCRSPSRAPARQPPGGAAGRQAVVSPRAAPAVPPRHQGCQGRSRLHRHGRGRRGDAATGTRSRGGPGFFNALQWAAWGGTKSNLTGVSRLLGRAAEISRPQAASKLSHVAPHAIIIAARKTCRWIALCAYREPPPAPLPVGVLAR